MRMVLHQAALCLLVIYLVRQSYGDEEKHCIDATGLNISSLFWSDNAYQRPEDPVTFNLCKNSDTACDIKLKNGTTIGDKFIGNSSTDFDEKMLTFSLGDDKYGTVFIYFSCDPNTLGKPVLLDQSTGRYYFEWKSHIACKGTVVTEETSKPQMPCYVYGENGLIDLSDLTNATSYKVKDASPDMRINICRNVTDISGCVGAVCLSDGTALAVAAKSTQLEVNDQGVMLQYDKPEGGCRAKINFKCPNSPSLSTGPTKVADNGCDYTIEWYTTHACPAGNLSSSTCKLQDAKYQVDIDLTPLNNNNKTYTVTESEFTYELAMCGATVKDCSLTKEDGSRGETVSCQKKPLDSSHHSLGLQKFTELKYADDVLTMVISKGDSCSSGFQRVTIINFHCDSELGIGQPEFVGETDCTYSFDWHTRYACNQQQSCIYKDPSDPSKVYDFSSLTVPKDSTSWTTSPGEGTRAFINICQPVGGNSKCDPTAAVCVKKTGKDADTDAYAGSGNLGQASTMKFKKEDNTITLTYDHGAVCNTQTKEQHQTVIAFACSNSQQGSSSVGPQMTLESSNTCKHKFIWFTPAACAQGTSPTTGCKVTTDGGYTYDFNPLAATDLVKDKFKFNPCKAVVADGGCGADATFCRDGAIVSKIVPKLVVQNNHMVTTTYTGAEGATAATVRYVCDHMAETPNITNSDESISVEVRTTLACAPKPIDCRPSDSQGNVYDFSGLKGTNWNVESMDGMKYYISLCSVLDKSDTEVKSCPGGATSACQVTKDGKYVNLGYATSNPEIISTGTIHFHYVNGAACGHGNKTPRQTTITLNCADVESTPRMKNEDGDCNYDIWWNTPKACPVKSSNAKNINCTLVKEGIKYDLTPLKAKSFNALYAGTNYYVGVCGKPEVPGKPGSCKDAGVCVKTSSGDPYSTGNLKDYSLVNSGGNIELHYEAGKDGKKSIITFVCGKKTETETSPPFKFLTDDGNTFRFQLHTYLVCPPVENVNCTRTINGHTYDFSSLVMHDGNYMTNLYSGERYFVNICHRLIATGEASKCPAGSTSCMYDPKEKKYKSLGMLSSNNTDFIHNVGSFVYIQYDNGDPCEAEPSKTLSTIILLRCDESGDKVVGAMEVGEKVHDCKQNLILESPVACTKKDVDPERGQKCGEIDGFDTKPLTKQYVIHSASHKYIVNFCQLTGTAAGEVSDCNGTTEFGVCQISKGSGHESILAGKANLKAELTDGRLVFDFDGGEICQHDPNHSTRNVILTIFCNQYAEVDSQPKFVNEDPNDCTYYISWPRKDICKDYVPCTVSNGEHVVDLSTLRESPYFDYATIGEGVEQKYQHKQYRVGICGSLPAAEYNQCAGAAVCQTTMGNSREDENLGFVDTPPQVVGTDKHIELVYPTQIPCSSQVGKMVSSVIKFSCGTSRGTPHLVSTDGCKYDFTWETDAVCSPAMNYTATGDCMFKRPTSEEVIDLTIFQNKVYKSSNYAIQICSSLPETELGTCAAGSAVCQDKKKSAGMHSSLHMYEHSGDVILQYTGGAPCRTDGEDSGTLTAMIEFRCNQAAGEGNPEYQSTGQRCVNLFIWETSYVCVPDCELNYMGHIFNFRHLTSNNRPHTLSANGYDFTINICKDLPINNKCGNYTNMCAQRQDGSYHPIATTSTIGAEYKPEDKTITLKYTSNNASSVCSTSGQTATVYMKLVCSGKFGSPVFVSEKDCTFTFKWETYVACHKKDLKEVEVEVKDGLFKDPVSGDTYSIKYAVEQKSVAVNYKDYVYAISLNSTLEETPCTDGETHVCQYKPSNTFNRAIGKQILNYYYQDGHVIVMIGSDSICGKVGTETVTTVMNLECDEKSSNTTTPAFVDEMISCRYLFKWDSPLICKPVKAAVPPGGSSGKLSPGMVAGIVIMVLVCVAATTGLIVYKVRRRRQWGGTYEYSGLSTDDDSTMLVTANKGGGPRFYDDDDDDIII